MSLRSRVLQRPLVVCLAIMLLSAMLPTERSLTPLNQGYGTWEKLSHDSSDLALIHDSGFGKSTPASRELAKDTSGWQPGKSATLSIRKPGLEIHPGSPAPSLPKSPWVGTIVLRI